MLKKLILITFILTISIKSSYSQFEILDVGARPLALSGAFTSLADNSNAVYYNPSGISQLKFREISVFYSPAPFGFSEMAYGALNFVEPTKFGAFGLSAKHYGFDLYREVTATLTYANKYNDLFHYGININYYNLNIKNYGSASTFGIDAGLLAKITDNLNWGFSAVNLSRSSIGDTKEKLPAVYRTGLSYKLGRDLTLIADAEKDTRFPLSIKAGIEYRLMDMITLRTGAGSEPSKFTAGIGINYSIFSFDYSFYNHLELGLTHQGSITINFGGTKGRKASDKLKYAGLPETDTSIKKIKVKKIKIGQTVNINYAGLESLMSIPYVSQKIAERIIEYRNGVGLIDDINELLNIKGIKEKKLEKIKLYIRLKDDS